MPALPAEVASAARCARGRPAEDPAARSSASASQRCGTSRRRAAIRAARRGAEPPSYARRKASTRPAAVPALRRPRRCAAQPCTTTPARREGSAPVEGERYASPRPSGGGQAAGAGAADAVGRGRREKLIGFFCPNFLHERRSFGKRLATSTTLASTSLFGCLGLPAVINCRRRAGAGGPGARRGDVKSRPLDVFGVFSRLRTYHGERGSCRSRFYCGREQQLEAPNCFRQITACRYCGARGRGRER